MNLFAIPVFSFVPGKYRKLVKESGGKIFGALLICFILLGLVTSIPAVFAFRDVMGTVREECPYFALKNGELRIEKPLLIDQDGAYMQIDDSIESVTAYDIDFFSRMGYEAVIVLGRSEGGVYQNGTIRVFDYKDLGDLSFDKNDVFNTFLPLLYGILIAVLIIAPFASIGVYYLGALILQLLTGALSKWFFKYDLTKTERFRITVLGKFPPYVLVYVLKYFGVYVTFLPKLLIELAFISLVLYFFSKGNDYDDYADDYTYAE